MSDARELVKLTADKLAGELTEEIARRAGLGPEASKALATFLSTTIALLLVSPNSKTALKDVAVPLIQKNLTLLSLTAEEAGACATAMVDTAVDASKMREFALAGPVGDTAWLAIMAYDALKLWGECYIPLDEQYRIAQAEREVLERIRARSLSSFAPASARGRLP